MVMVRVVDEEVTSLQQRLRVEKERPRWERETILPQLLQVELCVRCLADRTSREVENPSVER